MEKFDPARRLFLPSLPLGLIPASVFWVVHLPERTKTSRPNYPIRPECVGHSQLQQLVTYNFLGPPPPPPPQV